MYFVGIATLVMGLASFVYFGASELFLRGQTFGKRACKIRVVKTNGFALDAGSILLRNLFRVADHIPLLWIVPVVSQQSQRFGDMVAGTIVVNDQTEDLSSVRQQLAERPAAEARFRFDHAKLGRLRPSDVEAVERILERWPSLSLGVAAGSVQAGCSRRCAPAWKSIPRPRPSAACFSKICWPPSSAARNATCDKPTAARRDATSRSSLDRRRRGQVFLVDAERLVVPTADRFDRVVDQSVVFERPAEFRLFVSRNSMVVSAAA